MAKKLGYSASFYKRIEDGEQNTNERFLKSMSESFGISIKDAKELALIGLVKDRIPRVHRRCKEREDGG